MRPWLIICCLGIWVTRTYKMTRYEVLRCLYQRSQICRKKSKLVSYVTGRRAVAMKLLTSCQCSRTSWIARKSRITSSWPNCQPRLSRVSPTRMHCFSSTCRARRWSRLPSRTASRRNRRRLGRAYQVAYQVSSRTCYNLSGAKSDKSRVQTHR